MGTFLQKRGLKPGECPELWCIEHRAGNHLHVHVPKKTQQANYLTMMGVPPSDMTATMLESGADILGTNFGNGMERRWKYPGS